MTFIQKTFPENFIKSAEKLEENYFVEHKTQTDYFKIGYSAIPSLFRFCFDKSILKLREPDLVKNILMIDELYINLSTQELELNKKDHEKELKDIELNKKELEEAKIKILGIIELINNDQKKFDLNQSMQGISAYLYNNSNKAKPVNSFIEKFIDNKKFTDDFLTIGSTETIQDFIQSMINKGFVYDKENCLFGFNVEQEGIINEQLSQEEIEKLELIEFISDFVRQNDYDSYVNYVKKSNVNLDNLFKEKTLIAYSIAMDKKYFALELINSNGDSTSTKEGKLNDVLKQAMYSIVYRNDDKDKYLDLILSSINFDSKSKEYINDFVKTCYEPLKKSLSKVIFNTYKHNIDHKLLCLSLIRNNDVYRLEIPEMAEMIRLGFEKYPEDIKAEEGIISHFNYYGKTVEMIENLANTPTVLIKGIPLHTVINNYILEIENKISNITEVKLDFWEDDIKMRKEEDFLKLKIEKINEILSAIEEQEV